MKMRACRWSGAFALAVVVGAAAIGVGQTGCSSAQTSEGDSEEAASAAGKIAFGPRSDAALHALGQPVLVRGTTKIVFDRAVLLPHGGWHEVKLPSETLQIESAANGRTLHRTMPDGMAIVASTDDRGVTSDAEASYRLLRYQLPPQSPARAASSLVGSIFPWSRALDLVERRQGMAVEFAHTQAPLGVVTTPAGDRVLVVVAYLGRRDLTPAMLEQAGARGLRVDPDPNVDELVGLSFQYSVVNPIAPSEVVPIAQVSAVFAGTLDGDMTLRASRLPIVMVQRANAKLSTYPSPQLAQAAARAVATYAMSPLGLYLDYLGADAVPRTPCVGGSCTACPDGGVVARPNN